MAMMNSSATTDGVLTMAKSVMVMLMEEVVMVEKMKTFVVRLSRIYIKKKSNSFFQLWCSVNI